jgi:predicted RNA-binding protein Jag
VEIERPAPRAEPAPPVPATEEPPPVPIPEGRSLRIFPYAVSRSKLDRAIRDLGVPAAIVNRLEDADLVLTLKSQERRQPRRLRDAGGQTPVQVVKSNTVTQLENFLRAQFGVAGADFNDREAAMREVEEAVAEVIDRAQPAELQPRRTYLRRLQHQLVQRYGLHSGSLGDEPYRRVVIYPR